MKVESIAECSPWSILQYFWPALSNNQPLKPIFVFFISGLVLVWREERRMAVEINYFMINLQESMGPGGDQTHTLLKTLSHMRVSQYT